MMLIKKTVPLLLVACIFTTGCNVESSGAVSEITSSELPTNVTSISNDLEDAESSFATSENVPQEITVKITNEANEIFIDNVKHLNNYNENDFTINSENAMSNLIDLLIESDRWQDNFKLICTGMVDLEGEVFYQITLSTENDFSYSDIGVFWVNADNGKTYLKFDPTLNMRGYFSEFAVNIPEDDYRTRLILFS